MSEGLADELRPQCRPAYAYDKQILKRPGITRKFSIVYSLGKLFYLHDGFINIRLYFIGWSKRGIP